MKTYRPDLKILHNFKELFKDKKVSWEVYYKSRMFSTVFSESRIIKELSLPMVPTATPDPRFQSALQHYNITTYE